MKAKSIQYTIENPCDESWNDMTPETDGRFCDSCEKSVVDFTQMSDFSIVNYLENHKHEKVCGRFTKPQLDRVYQLNQPVFSPTFDLRAVVLGLALSTFSAIHSFSQTDSIPAITIDTTLNSHLPYVTMGWTTPFYNHENEKTVSGSVHTGSNNFKLVTVTLKTVEGTVLKSLQPDEKGRFKFDLYWDLKPASIEISGVGYQSQVLYFTSLRSLNNIRVHLLAEIELIRGEVIQGDVKATEDQILEKVEMGNVKIEKSEK